MKKVIVFLLIVLVAFTCLAGCKTEVKDGVYYRYAYEGISQTFVKTQISVTFLSDTQAYRYSYGDALSYYGQVTAIENGYVLKVREDVATQLLGLENMKTTNPERYELLKEYFDSITLDQIMYRSDKYTFVSSDIALLKGADNRDMASIDGYYDNLKDEKQRYYFDNGKVYSIAIADDGSSKQSDSPVARYYVQDGICTLVLLDDSGKDKVYEGVTQRISYLYANVTLSSNLSEYEISDDVLAKTLKEQVEAYSGKKVAVMVNAYFAAEE